MSRLPLAGACRSSQKRCGEAPYLQLRATVEPRQLVQQPSSQIPLCEFCAAGWRQPDTNDKAQCELDRQPSEITMNTRTGAAFLPPWATSQAANAVVVAE